MEVAAVPKPPPPSTNEASSASASDATTTTDAVVLDDMVESNSNNNVVNDASTMTMTTSSSQQSDDANAMIVQAQQQQQQHEERTMRNNNKNDESSSPSSVKSSISDTAVPESQQNSKSESMADDTSKSQQQQTDMDATHEVTRNNDDNSSMDYLDVPAPRRTTANATTTVAAAAGLPQQARTISDTQHQESKVAPLPLDLKTTTQPTLSNKPTSDEHDGQQPNAVSMDNETATANSDEVEGSNGIARSDVVVSEEPVIDDMVMATTTSRGDENDEGTNSSAVITPPNTTSSVEVIDLLDSDGDGDEEDSEAAAASDDAKELIRNAFDPPPTKRQRTEAPAPLQQQQQQQRQQPAPYPSPVATTHATNLAALKQHQLAQQRQREHAQRIAPYREHEYLLSTPGFIPTWKHMIPTRRDPHPNKRKHYELSLLNVSEFTITGLRVGDEYDGYMTSIVGLRSQIKQCSKPHGNAHFERDPDGGEGKWHIPLGAYHALYGSLKSDPLCRVEGISEAQLKIASLGKARLEKDYPSARKLVNFGVPKQLAYALAPFQRGGVDFVIERSGRALIADEMGLGKTIQGIASMSVYHEEWPLLVLCPSSARFHWENEFHNWLGSDSPVNNGEHPGAFDAERTESETEGDTDAEEKQEPHPIMPLLQNDQVHVLTSGQDVILPQPSTKVVICSYGLAPNLVNSGKLVPEMFKCAIVDESHMLKSKSTQRTSTLLPVLRATNRCVLLSGTPAFARPMELWPQLLILGTERNGWWQTEDDYIRKYARGGSRSRAELHTMLQGTVMIRRMKNDILKTLPTKIREQGVVDVMDVSTRREMQECMVSLRTGKGKLGELARGNTSAEKDTEARATANERNRSQQGAGGVPNAARSPSGDAATAQLASAIGQLRQSLDQKRAEGQAKIRHTLATAQHQLDPMMMQSFVQQMENRLESELHATYQEQVERIYADIASGRAPLPNAATENEAPSAKKAVLNHMYSLTGKSKVPLVAEMLRHFLKDPTRGKLCIFAHHIYVLDEIAQLAGLSNDTNSKTKYIRIDGSTTPRARQEQINLFQRDSSVRVAILGITAAGVAVTLTASSTVWFAELFWTPAIMIQAEDRCHRIGQQAHVRCLYFVAKGTLDELLWKLIENKFESLGEFVEGKEKMKMVVNKTYHSAHELLKTLTLEDLDDSGEDFSSDAESDGSLTKIEEISSDVEHEIEELGRSEQVLLDTEADNDGSDKDSQTELDAKPAAKELEIDALGKTEDDAICLSDDDDDDEGDDVEVVPVAAKRPQGATSQDMTSKEKILFDPNRTYPRLRHYKLLCGGHAYGIDFFFLAGRLIVSGKDKGRDRELGADVKPHVGDVLVAVNRQVLPLVPEMEHAMTLLYKEKSKGPAELMFAEDSEIAAYMKERMSVANGGEEARPTASLEVIAQHPAIQRSKTETHRPSTSLRAATSPNEVIEID